MGDDRKIELSEWMSGYKGAGAYGFAALKGLTNDTAAKTLFQKVQYEICGNKTKKISKQNLIPIIMVRLMGTVGVF